MSTPTPKRKLALLTNMIAPYRIPLFSFLADEFDLLILHGGKEANRDSWSSFERELPRAKVVRAWGWQLKYARKINGEVFDEKFLHITPGFLWHLLRFQPDAVISTEMGFRSMIALAFGILLRKPVWIWWGGTLHTERDIGLLRQAIRKGFMLFADRWVSYGQTSTEYLLALGIKRERILQLQNSIDERRFQPGVDPAWTVQPKPVLLHVGQFIERKGIGALLKAAAQLQQQGSTFSMLLVGSGRDKEMLERRAQALNLQNVHFLPPQPAERMPAVYRSADVLIFPTLEDVWGLVANEAILSEISILCSKYAGCAPELFAPENIFSPDDEEEFARKLADAVAMRLPKVDPSRLKSTPQLGSELTEELNRALQSSSTSQQQQSQFITQKQL
jgi:glycosyltransferase involved in cell wall biosynthesis